MRRAFNTTLSSTRKVGQKRSSCWTQHRLRPTKEQGFQNLFVQHNQSHRSLWSLLNSISDSSRQTAGMNGNAELPKSQKLSTSMSMPARQSDSTEKSGELRQDPELQGILNRPIGSFDASTWLRASNYAESMADNENFPLAFEILDRMVEEPDSKRNLSNSTIYDVIQKWSAAFAKSRGNNSRDQNKKQQPQHTTNMYAPSTIWRRIESYQKAGIPMESRIFHRIIESTSYVKSRKMNSPALAEKILDRMMVLSKQKDPNVRPSTFTYNAVIASWEAMAAAQGSKSASAQREASERALVLLEQLKTLYATGWGDEFMPDKVTYRRVMNLFAHRGDGDKVEALLQELYDLYLEHGHDNLAPNTPFFSLVLYAWSKSNDPEAAERASTILEHILKLEKTQEIPGLKISAFCFNIVMVCWSRQRTAKSAAKAQSVFDQMVALSKSDKSKTPVAGSYAALIQTWRWWDPKRAEEAFWTWKREHNAGNCDMLMDNKLFSSLISGWFHSKDADAAIRCDKLLQYALGDNLGEAWSPHTADFNLTINAYCRTKKKEGIDRARTLINQMDSIAKASKSGDFPGPTATSYSPIVHALTQMGKVEQAEEVLREWFERHPPKRWRDEGASRDGNKKEKRLDTRTLNHVLKAWLLKASLLPYAADRAENLLLSMEDWGVKPNARSFQYVLDCRKKSRRKSTNGVNGDSTRADGKSNASEIVKLLDKVYENGHNANDKEAYLNLRQGWSLMTV